MKDSYILDLAPHNANGLRLRSPVMTASGCLGLGSDQLRLARLEAIGAVVTPTVTMTGRKAERYLIETSGALLVGTWSEYSLASVLSDRLESWSIATTPLLISIRAEHSSDYSRLAQQLDERSDIVSGFEVCMTEQSLAIDQIIKALHAVSLLPVLVKLPHRPTEITELARAAANAGADALVVAAPPLGMHIEPHTEAAWQGHVCGAAIFPIMLRLLSEIVSAVPIAVIASGGISKLSDAQAILQVGAQALQIGSTLLSEPGLAARISESLLYPV